MRFALLEVRDADGELECDRPIVGPLTRWLGGVLMPLLLSLYGLHCALSMEAVIGTHTPFRLFGENAIAFGLGVMAVALLIHLSLFWDSLYDSTRICARGKFACFAIVGLCAYFLCVRLLMYCPQ